MERAAAVKEARAKRKKKIIAVASALAAVAILVTGVAVAYATGLFAVKFEVTYHATIEVEDYGTIHLELYGKEAPETVANFIKLANEGFYDGLTFHRVIAGFMAQGGMPADGNDADTIIGEFESNGIKNRIKHKRGVISMARPDDKDGASSQFFIMHKDNAQLDGDYAAFGRVISGMDVIDRICEDATPINTNGILLESARPIIKSITTHPAH
ncbi:MAG: peptidylprolyl isomerase [Clostridia bacterium]|nr:peptidylprolyl isomerase [Clostridia bacterium]